MYSDPSGDIFEIIFGIGNLLTRLKNGSVNNFWQGTSAFFQGFITGALTGGGIATSINPIHDFGMVSGVLEGISKENWERFNNAVQLYWGNFYIDEHRTFAGGIWQGFSRFTWENPQNFYGSRYSQLKNIIGKVDRVDFLGGATFATNENASRQNGISLGNYINVNISDQIEGDFVERVLTDPLFMHEYGHYIDSQGFGLSYLLAVGLPSLISASGNNPERHSNRVYEMRANRYAARYFRKHYGVEWTPHEGQYPR